MLYKLTGSRKLMSEEPVGKLSIEARESIVLPLLTIQQHALKKLQELIPWLMLHQLKFLMQ